MKYLFCLLLTTLSLYGRAIPGVGLNLPASIAPGLYGGTTSLVGWYDRKGLTNYTTQAADNSLVGAWINNLPYSHTMDLSNSGGTFLPKFTNNYVGSAPGVCFVSASSTFLNTSTNGPSTIGGTNFTIIMLIDTNSLTPAWALGHLCPTNSTDSNGMEFWDGGPADGPEWDALRGSAGGTYRFDSYTNGIRGATRWCILAAATGMATNDMQAWFNSNTNQVRVEASNGNPGPLAETNRVFNLAMRGNRTSYSSLHIIELLIYNKKLSGGERFAVETYLRRKYGEAKIP